MVYCVCMDYEGLILGSGRTICCMEEVGIYRARHCVKLSATNSGLIMELQGEWQFCKESWLESPNL